MKMRLYTLDPPHGRCLLLAQKLHQATGMTGSDSLQIAQRLFAGQHTRINPTIVDVPQVEFVDDLVATCIGFGIAIESVDVPFVRPVLQDAEPIN